MRLVSGGEVAMLGGLRWPGRRGWSSKTSGLGAFWSGTLMPQRLGTRGVVVSLPSVGWRKEAAMGAGGVGGGGRWPVWARIWRGVADLMVPTPGRPVMGMFILFLSV